MYKITPTHALQCIISVMKRTKNDWYEGHPQDRSNISGATYFDGEDLWEGGRKTGLFGTIHWIQKLQ